MPFSPQLFFTEEQRLFQMFQMGPAFSRVGGSIAKRDFPGGGGVRTPCPSSGSAHAGPTLLSIQLMNP